jgi:signal transduction histidine kinase
MAEAHLRDQDDGAVATATPSLGRRLARALARLRAIYADESGAADAGTVCTAVANVLGGFLGADAVVVSTEPVGLKPPLPVGVYGAENRPFNPRVLDLRLAADLLAGVPAGGFLQLDGDGPGLLADAERLYLRQLGVAVTLIIPLVRHGQRVGRIDIVALKPVTWSQVELDLVTQAASHAALVLALTRAEATEADAASGGLILRVSEALRQAQPGSPSELLQVVAALLPDVLGCERCYAYLWHAERNVFLPAAVSGMREDQVATLKQHPMLPTEVALFEQLLYSTRPLAIDDARDSTLLQPDLVRQLGTRALLALPLRGRRHEMLGAIMLDNADSDRSFSQEQVALCRRVADQIAAMVENATLYEEVSRRSDRLAVLNEIGLHLASLVDVPAVFPALHAKLASVIDASAIFCAVLEPDSTNLTVYHMAGPALQTRTEVPLAESVLLMQVFEEGHGTVLQAGAAPLVATLTGDASVTAQSLVCAPLRMRGQQVVGALAAYSTFEHAYAAADLELLSTVASQIAVALENARLYSQVQAKGELRGQLLDRIMSAHELERKSIVDDIHDDSLQTMVSTMYKIDLCLRLSETQNHTRELEELRNVRSSLAANVERLRSLIFEIRPSTLDYLGLLPTLDDHLARLEAATGIKPHFRSELGARLDTGLETLIYRLLQELLSNVRKHARAKRVLIELKRVPAGVRVVVEDDGVGFDPQTVMGGALAGEGIGLPAVRERVQVAGGAFDLTSRPGQGTRVEMVLPMTAGQHITGPLVEARLSRDSAGE